MGTTTSNHTSTSFACPWARLSRWKLNACGCASARARRVRARPKESRKKTGQQTEQLCHIPHVIISTVVVLVHHKDLDLPPMNARAKGHHVSCHVVWLCACGVSMPSIWVSVSVCLFFCAHVHAHRPHNTRDRVAPSPPSRAAVAMPSEASGG